MAYRATYRTNSGQNYFSWSFEDVGNEVRIYITNQPSYEGRDSGAHETHRYGISSGRPYICFEPPPTNLKDAINIAKEWAERTERYIDYGTF